MPRLVLKVDSSANVDQLRRTNVDSSAQSHDVHWEKRISSFVSRILAKDEILHVGTIRINHSVPIEPERGRGKKECGV